jgi:uncharacterized protein YbjT (DUF2867 family)
MRRLGNLRTPEIVRKLRRATAISCGDLDGALIKGFAGTVTRESDVEATTALLGAAWLAGVEHFVHVSIVGLPNMARGSAYARVKLAAEECVKCSRVPWSIVRASEFYWLLERMLEKSTRRSVLLLPAELRRQPVDSNDFARFVVKCVPDGRRGEREDFAGPQDLTMRELAEQYFAARGLQRRIWSEELAVGPPDVRGARRSRHP